MAKIETLGTSYKTSISFQLTQKPKGNTTGELVKEVSIPLYFPFVTYSF